MNRTRARIEKMMAIKINIHVNTSYKLSTSWVRLCVHTKRVSS